MRKIEDLKENECIEIRTKKEAKGIAKLCKHIINDALQEGGDIAVMESWATYEHPCIAYNKVNENSSYISYSYVEFFKTHKRTIIPASDFLPNKNSLKKRIKALESKVDTLVAKECVVKECKEVKENPKEIDWSKPRQLVSTDTCIIVITCGIQTDNTFLGAYIPTGAKYSDPQQRYWLKSEFKLYDKPITLCNEE